MKHQDIYTVLTTYYTHGEVFKLVRHEETNKILAINTKYITNGKTNTALRGFEMFISETTRECIDRIEVKYKEQEYIDAGYGTAAAIALAHGESIEKALELQERFEEVLSM